MCRDCLTLKKRKLKKESYRRTCSSPGVTVPGRITPVPLTVPKCTWKTGLRVRPDDCNRVFNTSRGQVTIAPTVPLHLQFDHINGMNNCSIHLCSNNCISKYILQKCKERYDFITGLSTLQIWRQRVMSLFFSPITTPGNWHSSALNNYGQTPVSSTTAEIPVTSGACGFLPRGLIVL